MISKHLFCRLQEEYEKFKQRDTENDGKDVNRPPSDGEDLIERIKYHQELVDLERKVILFARFHQLNTCHNNISLSSISVQSFISQNDILF